ncbi:hypothetical protein P280DRAFT_405220 [Massarina eburnea CBS 473.64]|uniref:Rhodopsin domain-containing protein n=1 Tax=Massarina eburnea CBS 473.64 TaxID=1395130 RepID=A0A6A6RSK5_9PLEO|nr:hypothetical protein P280DRAFT_405220 [Massarina eburnea CBS 473.64]
MAPSIQWRGVNLHNTPLMQPPPGVTSNFVDPPNLINEVAITGLFLLAASGFCLCVRLYTNLKREGRLAIEDILCILGEICGIGKWAAFYSLALNDFCRHTWDIPLSAITEATIKLETVNQMFSAPGLLFTKAAILVLYIRLFGSVRWMRWTALIYITFISIIYTAGLIVVTMTEFKNTGPPGVRKVQPIPGVGMIAIGIFGVLCDIAIFALPLMPIIRLQLNRRKKVGLLLVFLMGFLTIVTSGVALIYRVQVASGKDPNWAGAHASVTTIAEIFGTVIVGCGPGMSSFWQNIFTKSKFYNTVVAAISSGRSGAGSKATGASSTLGAKPKNYAMLDGDTMPYPNGTIGSGSGGLGNKGGIMKDTVISIEMEANGHR